ncbi:MAG: ArsR family transcriptional regulator [Desulfurococcales archaeon]|nr:ArsR family transcriptional regulator [Desulfurococcales archaeon]
MGIEDILTSKGRIRVIKVLLKYGATNINTLIRESGLTHRLVNKYITELKEENLVTERRYGRLRVIEINYQNPKVSMLKMLLEE